MSDTSPLSADADPRLQVVAIPLDEVQPHPRNPRRGDVAAIANSLLVHGQYRPIVVQKSTGYVLAGNHTWKGARRLRDNGASGWDRIDAVVLDVDDVEANRIMLVDNRTAELGDGYDDRMLTELLRELPDLDGTGWDDSDLDALLEEMGADLDPSEPVEPGADEDGDGDRPDVEAPRPTLADRFIVPPFSILDARGGAWRTRKQYWMGYGIQSELGRGGTLAYQGQESLNAINQEAAGRVQTDGTTAPADSKYAQEGPLTLGSASGRVPTYYTQKNAAEAQAGRELSHEEFTRDHLDSSGASENLSTSGTSIFDPVLVELAVRWFSPPGGHVLDPFAGGSVRGLVTTLLGRSYEGIELRAEQVEANESQRHIAPPAADLTWTQGDSDTVLDGPGRPADLVLSCPPYAYLEKYSDDPADLSTMTAGEFKRMHAEIIRKAMDRLAPNRYAVWVIGDVREKRGDGRYLGLIRDTIDAFETAGCGFYNEMIYVTPVGSLAVRVGRQFMAGRKVGRTHQHVLVFVKGDGKQAARDCGPVEVDVPEPAEDAPDDVETTAAADLAPA